MIRILFILAACAPLLSEAAVRPNIVTVFIDDMGWTDLSCFRGDHVKTENIDRLAAEGILEDRCIFEIRLTVTILHHLI